MNKQTDMEQKIYDSAGGGERGEKAVNSYREYMKDYRKTMRHYAVEKKTMQFLPRNGKTVGTVSNEDEYEG